MENKKLQILQTAMYGKKVEDVDLLGFFVLFVHYRM